MVAALRNPTVRIAAAALLLVALVAVGLMLLRMQPTEEDHVRDAVVLAVDKFQRREADAFLNSFTEYVDIDTGRYGRFSLRSEFAGEVHRAFSNLGFINIRPRDIKVLIEGGGSRALVDMTFHWTASSAMYPNARTRSEDRNLDGNPEQAELLLVREGNSWLIRAVSWQPGGNQ